MNKVTVKGIWEIFKTAGKDFGRKKVMKLSASLAYYTIFSLGPMLIVIIYLSNIFWGKEAIEGTVVGQIRGLVGNGAALQIQQIIKNAYISGTSKLTAIVGFITLLIGATTVFSEIQDSINTIWNLKVKPETGWFKIVLSRLLSFSLIVGLGFLLLVSLIINGLMDALMGHLQQIFPHVGVVVVYIANQIITLLVIGFLFAIIFKVLPDAVITWKDVSTGAVFTAVLFTLARFGISFYIGKSNIGSSYGAAGSLVVLLLWIYFSSAILYFGAVFTKAYAVKYGSEIKPDEYAVTVQTVQVESGKTSVQQNEKEAGETQNKMQETKNSMNKNANR